MQSVWWFKERNEAKAFCWVKASRSDEWFMTLLTVDFGFFSCRQLRCVGVWAASSPSHPASPFIETKKINEKKGRWWVLRCRLILLALSRLIELLRKVLLCRCFHHSIATCYGLEVECRWAGGAISSRSAINYHQTNGRARSASRNGIRTKKAFWWSESAPLMMVGVEARGKDTARDKWTAIPNLKIIQILTAKEAWATHTRRTIFGLKNHNLSRFFLSFLSRSFA